MTSEALTGSRTTAVQAERERWPRVFAVPRARLRGWSADQLMRHAVRRLPVRLVLPDGQVLGSGGPESPSMLVHRPRDFQQRVGARGLLGFGESYQAGDWDSEDLPGLLTAFATRLDRLVPAPLQRLRALHVQRRPRADRNSPDGARRNIARHYDLSDDLFTLFLDPTLTYSSALFAEDRGRPVASEELLPRAQHRKIDRLLDMAEVGPGTRLLEIGSGWGELALRAAARGAVVRTVTLSENQRSHVEDRAALAGLERAVTVDLCDYRDVRGEYDVILSVEMIEAVGLEQWPVYFAALARLLAPGGRIGLQAITMPHSRMLATADTHTWITEYVFPGGLIPSVTAIERSAAGAGLHIWDRRAFGPHYAQTLRLWRERFLAQAGELGRLGFDETFRRTWELYLAYSEAGFASGYLDVYQFLIAAGPQGPPRGQSAR